MTTTRSTIDELREINARFIHHFITNDVAGHYALLHPDGLKEV